MDDWAFVGGDGMGSLLECRSDVIDRRLAVFYVERCGFEQDIGLRVFKPGENFGG